MVRQTLDILCVASVMPLGLRLWAVEDGEAGHIVNNLHSREAVEVGPGVLAAVAVNLDSRLSTQRYYYLYLN